MMFVYWTIVTIALVAFLVFCHKVIRPIDMSAMNNNNWARMSILLWALVGVAALISGFGPGIVVDGPTAKAIKKQAVSAVGHFNKEEFKASMLELLGSGHYKVMPAKPAAQVQAEETEEAPRGSWFWWKAFMWLTIWNIFFVPFCLRDEAIRIGQAVWKRIVSRNSASGSSATPADVASAKQKGGWTFYKDLLINFIAEFSTKGISTLIGR